MLSEVKKIQGSERGSERRKEKKSKARAKGTEGKVFRGFAIWAFSSATQFLISSLSKIEYQRFTYKGGV